jgi:hypothetical protein
MRLDFIACNPILRLLVPEFWSKMHISQETLKTDTVLHIGL